MPIRVTGMISGLDTEALVSAMVSAYSVKKKKAEKNVQTLKWKQDAWSGLNTKIKSLYSNISNLRFTAAYSLKKATISDPTKATVSAAANAASGSQNLVIKKLASAGYLTGAKLQDGTKSSTKLSDLDPSFTEGDVTVSVGGKTSNIHVTRDTTIGSFVNSLKDAGLSANFDEKNGRIFASAQSSGVSNDFSMAGSNAGGLAALSAMGLNVQSDKNEATYQSYYNYGTQSNDILGRAIRMDGTREEAIEDINAILNKLSSNKDDISTLTETNAELKSQRKYAEDYKGKQEVFDGIKNSTVGTGAERAADAADMEQLLTDGNLNKYVDTSAGPGNYKYYDRMEEIKDQDDNVTGYKYFYTDSNGDEQTEERSEKLQTVTEKVTDIVKKYDTADELKSQKLDDDGEPLFDNGDPVMEFDNSKISTYLSKVYTQVQDTKTYEEEYASAHENVDPADNLVLQIQGDPQAKIDSATAAIEANEATISAYNTELANNKLIDTGESADAIYDKIKQFSKMYEDIKFDRDNAEAIAAGNETARVNYSAGAVRVNGQDSEITLNGADYTSSSNNYSINGLTINATGVTDEKGVSVTVDTDTQAIYDKVKGFLKQYNELINEMNKLYNADSAKGYEPLSDEEKDAMTDDEVERWEKKIKDSLLRRDTTLGGVLNSMVTAMSSRFEINGKSYSLSSFGIKTKSYFETEEHDNYAYHIDGDKDDTYSSGNADKLMKAITEDAEGVVEFFKNLTSSLYKAVDDKMKGTTLSTAYTVYNDKQLKTDIAKKESEVKKWEDMTTQYEDYWFKKYAAMEKTLAQLQSKTSSLGSMMG